MTDDQTPPDSETPPDGETPPEAGSTPEGRKFLRPWEVDESGPVETDDRVAEALPDPEDVWTALEQAKTSGNFPIITDEDILAASTREYQGLAEQITRTQDEVVERQAVAAALPGVGSGLVGFEDVTGVKTISEEEVEHEEQKRASDLAVRVGSGLVLLGLFVGSLLLGGVWFSAMVTVVMVIAAGELFATLRTRGYRPVSGAGLIGVLIAGIGTHLDGLFAVAGGLAVTLLLVGMVFSFQNRRNPLENAAVTVLSTAWVGMLAFAVAIGRSDNAFPLILAVVLLTAGFDIGAYFIGRAFGRRQIAPVVSPQKTVEGLIGGVAAAFGLGMIIQTLPPFDPIFEFGGILVLVSLVVVLAPFGDAAESVVKRALDVKDMGSLLPGHGGMLDRIDALLFVVPAAYLAFNFFGYL